MRILLVDDDPVSLRVLRQIISVEPGHQITEAKSGSEAWKLLDNPSLIFDVVFLDVSMPETDGLQVLARIRESQILRSQRVVMCTATSDRETVQKVIQLGTSHFIVKPATAPRVHAKLQQIQAEIAADSAPGTRARGLV
ncbi:MAG TPA: response regulator [Opitutaceae bacterium]|nr:response regulator [Opitutaceae bacterium]